MIRTNIPPCKKRPLTDAGLLVFCRISERNTDSIQLLTRWLFRLSRVLFEFGGQPISSGSVVVVGVAVVIDITEVGGVRQIRGTLPPIGASSP